MKTFNDLEFKIHPNNIIGFKQAARMHFDNGYGVSVITGSGAYSDSEHPYEVAVLKDNDLCYSTHITDDVIGYNNEDDVTNIMRQVQELSPDVTQ